MNEEQIHQEKIKGGEWDTCPICGNYRWHRLIYCSTCLITNLRKTNRYKPGSDMVLINLEALWNKENEK